MNLIISTILWIALIGGLSFKLKKEIAGFIKKIPLSKFWLFLISGISYSIIEENINCPPSGCALIPLTIPIFILFLMILFGIIKIFKIKNFYLAVLIFGIIGWISEFVFGYHKEILWSSGGVVILMSIWVILTYIVIAIIPVAILSDEDKIKKS